MTGEIDSDFFCPYYVDMYCNYMGNNRLCDLDRGCPQIRRKWPTPEQYKAEYGAEYPDDGAVYFIGKEHPLVERPWHADELSFPKSKPCGRDFHIVCACTPWGKPDAEWRPS